MRSVLLTLPLLALTLPALLSSAQTPTASNLAQQASAAHDTKHFAESITLYTRALSLADDTERASLEYNLACSQSLAGDRDAAFQTLAQAVADGYFDRKGTEADTDLTSLHTDPRWQPLLSRMSAESAAQDRRWGDAAFAAIPYSPNLSNDAKLAGLSELWAQAKYSFANFWHVPDLNWDQTYRDFIPQVQATTSTADYYKVLERFYALLQDGHTTVYPPDEVSFGRVPIETTLVDNHVLVTGKWTLQADMDGLVIGDEVVSINGQPVRTYATEKIRPFCGASSPQDLAWRMFSFFLLTGPVGDTLTLATKNPSGATSTHHLKIAEWANSQRPSFSLRPLPAGLLYIALNSFNDDTAAKEWDKHWPEISRARGLILDLRENGGGNSNIGAHILATLISRPVPGELSRSTRWIASYRAWGYPQLPRQFPIEMLPPDPAHQFRGPVTLLISPRTYSAAEDMVVLFVQAHRGTLIGESTGGSTGQPLTFKLPGGGTARVCTKHDAFADGHEFVGVGIPPDLPAHPTRTDLVTGRDSVLDLAVHTLEKQTSPSATP